MRDQIERKHFDAFLPTVTRWSRWKDRKKKIDWPLFPGYCFARFKEEETLAILKCTGVVNIVSFEGKPAPIPEHEIEGIRRLLESDLQYDPCPLIREGMMVEVTHGALKGVVGTPRPQGGARAPHPGCRPHRPGRQRRGRRRRRQAILACSCTSSRAGSE